MQTKSHESNADRQKAYRERQVSSRAAERAARGLPTGAAAPAVPGRPRWKALLAEAKATLETVAAEMQDYHDDRTERWQEGEKGTTFLESVEKITEIADEIEQVEI